MFWSELRWFAVPVITAAVEVMYSRDMLAVCGYEPVSPCPISIKEKELLDILLKDTLSLDLNIQGYAVPVIGVCSHPYTLPDSNGYGLGTPNVLTPSYKSMSPLALLR